ncbi:MAG TPA: hypothetical protein VI815_02920 [Candidatus Nanoarchaeia archaeon]|nr:hypothetical protein [Candidatus Nanoarchaeia archaeon]
MGRQKGAEVKAFNVSFEERCEELGWDSKNIISSIIKDRSINGNPKQIMSKSRIPIPSKRRRGAS